MRLILAGTPEPAVVALQRLLDSEHEVVAVLTRPDARRGRGRTLHPSPVKELALEHGIEVLTPSTLKPGTEDGMALRARLAQLQPDAIPVVAYGNLITTDLLDLPEHGWVNLHFSLLPAWRGAAPVQAAIAAGDARTGASTFRIDEGLDTGEVLGTLVEDIRPTDTTDDLLTRLAYAGADLLVETMDKLAAGQAVATPQEGEATYAPKISTDDARIDWAQPAEIIDRHIRAHTPGPGAWTTLDGERFKVGPVSIVGAGTDVDAEGSGNADVKAAEGLAPGQARATKHAVYVGTGTHPVRMGRVQPPAKKKMDAADWARGLDKEAGEVNFQ